MITNRFTGQPVEYREGGELIIAGVAATVYDGTERTEFVLRRARHGLQKVVERVMPGAFRDVLKSDPDVRVLRNHNSDQLLGRTRSGTARVYVDSRGNLAYTCLAGNSSVALDTVDQLRRGDLSGSSFAFRTGIENFRQEQGVGIVEIKQVDSIYDVGPAVMPCYRSTTAFVRHRNPHSALDRFDTWARSQATERPSYLDRARRASWQPIRVPPGSPLSVRIASYKLRAMRARE